jgi:hypothetical protein
MCIEHQTVIACSARSAYGNPLMKGIRKILVTLPQATSGGGQRTVASPVITRLSFFNRLDCLFGRLLTRIVD